MKKILLILALTLISIQAGQIKEPPTSEMLPIPKTKLYILGGGSYELTQKCCCCETVDVYGSSALLGLGYSFNDYVGVEARGLTGFNQHASILTRFVTNKYKVNVFSTLGYGHTKNDYNEFSSIVVGGGVAYKNLNIEVTKYNNKVSSIAIYILHKF